MLLAEENIFVCGDDLSEGLCFVLGFFSTVKKTPKKAFACGDHKVEEHHTSQPHHPVRLIPPPQKRLLKLPDPNTLFTNNNNAPKACG